MNKQNTRTSKEARKNQLIYYLVGWRTGAGNTDFLDKQLGNPNFEHGYQDGRNAKANAYFAACRKYKTKLGYVF